MGDSLEQREPESLAQGLIGTRSLVAEELGSALEGAMVARLLHTAHGIGLSAEQLNLVQSILFCWTWAAGEGRLDRQEPLSFGVEVDELADMAGIPATKVNSGLQALRRDGAIRLPRVSGERLTAEIDLSPLLKREYRATSEALRRVWSSWHFRELHRAWVDRVGELEAIFEPELDAEDEDGSEAELASPEIQDRWGNLSCRNLSLVADMFRRPWSNCEAIYEGFLELVAFDDLAFPITEQQGIYEPLSKLLHKHAGMRAQVRREKALGYTTEPLN